MVTSAAFLPVSQVNKLAPALGCCVALKSMAFPDCVIGYLFSGDRADPPPADLSSSVAPDGKLTYLEALTEDGQAFLDLVRGR
jgi:hypothetical protein